MESPIHVSDIAYFVKLFGNKRARNVFRRYGKQTDISRLARKFAVSERREEQVWAREIVGDSSTSQAYIQLRSKVKRRLLGHLFDLDLNKGSVMRRMMYSNMRRVFMIRVLAMLGARGAAMSLVPMALTRARKFEFTLEAIELLRLSRTYASFRGNRLEFKKYDGELAHMLLLLSAENRIASLTERFDVESIGRSDVGRRLKLIVTQSLVEAEQIFADFPTFNVGLNYFRIATTAAEIGYNFERSIRLCGEAAAFFADYPHLQNPSFDGQFALKRLTASISLRALEKGQLAAKECKQYFESGTNNWFVVMEHEFLLYLHGLKFDLASACLTEVVSNRRFESQAEQVRQKWAGFGHYIDFVRPEAAPRKTQPFNKSIREIPIYAKDKAGYNITLIILQYLVLVDRGKFDEIITRSEALSQYLTRNLRMKQSKQLYAFIKCLVLLQKHDFSVAKSRRYTARYVRVFSTGQYPPGEAQVLPFQYMWDNLIVARLPAEA